MTVYTHDRSAKRIYTGILPALYDKINVTYPTDVIEIYTFSLFNPNSNAYTLAAIIEIEYVDNTKERISSVTKTFDSGV